MAFFFFFLEDGVGVRVCFSSPCDNILQIIVMPFSVWCWLEHTEVEWFCCCSLSILFWQGMKSSTVVTYIDASVTYWLVSQTGWGWPGFLHILWSNPHAQADCTGPCPVWVPFVIPCNTLVLWTNSVIGNSSVLYKFLVFAVAFFDILINSWWVYILSL